MAVQLARDVYTRRQEGVSIWVAKSADIVASDPGEADALARRCTTSTRTATMPVIPIRAASGSRSTTMPRLAT